MSLRTFQKFQPNTKRGIVKNCQICTKSFSVLNVEHQCKRCLRAICKECGKTKRDVYKIGMIKNPHRLCQICSKQSDFIKQYISTNQLKFGEDSAIGRKWANRVPDREEEEQKQRVESQSQFYKAKFTYEMFCEVWDAYNYSMREFVGLLTFEKNQKQVYKQVNYVYKCLMQNGFTQKLQTIIFLIIFILCFTSQDSCLRIIQHLLSLESIPQSKMLLQAYLKALKTQDSEVKKITEYLATRLKTFIGSFSVNVVSVECSIHLITRIMEKEKIEEAYILFAIVVDQSIRNLVAERQNKIECDLELVKNCRLDKFMDKYRLASTAKVAHLVRSKKSIISPNKSQKITESPSHTYQDNISNKTRSIREEASLKQLISTNQQRKTQKPLLLPKINQKYAYQQYGNGQCFECEKYRKKIQDLQSKLKLKEREIENLNFMVSFRKGSQSQGGFGRSSGLSEREVLQKELSQHSYENNLYNQLSQQKRENLALKSQIQQLQQSNKILKNAMSSQPLTIQNQPNSSILSQQQTLIMLQTLKQKLQTKSKQYQQTIKKNKLLNYQIQEMQRQYAIKKPESNVGTREELTKKLEELSLRVSQEQEEKIKVANQLFQLKEVFKGIGVDVEEKGRERISFVKDQSQLVGVKKSGRQECNIF